LSKQIGWTCDSEPYSEKWTAIERRPKAVTCGDLGAVPADPEVLLPGEEGHRGWERSLMTPTGDELVRLTGSWLAIASLPCSARVSARRQ
jgi:hypothetical protein